MATVGTQLVLVLGLQIFFFPAFAAVTKHGPTPEQEELVHRHNGQLATLPLSIKPFEAPVDRAVSDLEPAGYLFFSSDVDYDSLAAKQKMAKELPAGVTLVVYADTNDNVESIKRQYRGHIDERRLKVVTIPNASRGFWTRDGLPVPVWTKNNTLGVVDSRYYHNFEPDDMIARWFRTNAENHDYYFEGGNFMVNDAGECITVDNRLSKKIPDQIFHTYYGCRRLIRLPFEKGIGHVDESVRFVARNRVMTDSSSYATRLRREGYEVIQLPRPRRNLETYVNSLLVNDTMFVPIFNQATDAEALRIYREAGFKTVPLDSVELSNFGNGSIHCITMTYPKVPFDGLLEALGGSVQN